MDKFDPLKYMFEAPATPDVAGRPSTTAYKAGQQFAKTLAGAALVVDPAKIIHCKAVERARTLPCATLEQKLSEQREFKAGARDKFKFMTGVSI